MEFCAAQVDGPVDDLEPGYGAFLGPISGGVLAAVTEVEARSETQQVTVTVSRAAAEAYARYGVESSTLEIWRALIDALARPSRAPSHSPRASTRRLDRWTTVPVEHNERMVLLDEAEHPVSPAGHRSARACPAVLPSSSTAGERSAAKSS